MSIGASHIAVASIADLMVQHNSNVSMFGFKHTTTQKSNRTCRPMGAESRPELLSSDASTGKAVNEKAAPVNSRNALKLGGAQLSG